MRRLPLRVQVGHQCVERLGHVAVAQVPGLDAPAKHHPVILFCVLHQPCVLKGCEELVARDAPVAARVVGGAAAQLDELSYDFALTRFGHAEGRRVAVGLRVLAEVLEAGVAITRPLRRFGINLVQIAEHGLDGGVKAVEV